MLILSGLIVFIIFIFLINVAYQRARKAKRKSSFTSRKLLKKERDKANRKQLLVEQKNAEIIDSINYAKKVQDAILPSEDRLRAAIPNSFVVFLPKDIVAGDFYWF